LIAYLPSDDVFYREHLAGLCAALDDHPHAVLAYSGLRHHYNREMMAVPTGAWLQLVQCLHRRCRARWIERDEFESDDLETLYWCQLRGLGDFVSSGVISCEWVDHPAQRHKLMQEPLGGINPFRQHYRVARHCAFAPLSATRSTRSASTALSGSARLRHVRRKV
jgi:hypothetical protein